jgi:superfamily II DNA or RNA helicase
VSEALALREYQHEAIAALTERWADGGQRLAVVLPTGAGKTVVMAKLSHDRRGQRVLILVHRDELIQQTVDKLRRMDRTLSVGIVRGSQNEGGAAVVVASIQTVQRAARLAQIGTFGTIIVDECHRSASESYVRVLESLGAWVPWGPRVAGFTATMSRGDTRGLGDIWEEVVYTKGIKWFVERGYLVPPTAKAVVTDLDLDTVKKTAGDYNERALGIAMTTEDTRTVIVDAYREHASDRQGVLFAPTVDSAEYFADGLTAAGFPAAGMFGSTPRALRRERNEQQRKGELQVLVSCTALAEGWDAPWVSAAVLARPTLHQGLFIQQIGRVLRPWPGKTDAIVLDAAGATQRHNLHALIELNETPEVRDPDDDPWDEDEEDGGGDTAPKRYDKAQGWTDVDLFAGTEARWRRTDRGVLFVSTRNSLYFLAADDGRWRVGKTPQHGGRVEWLRTDCESGEALMWAGELAVEEDPSVASSKARWRRRGGSPSDAQRGFARSLGINPDGLDKVTLSDTIDITKASRMLARVPV